MVRSSIHRKTQSSIFSGTLAEPVAVSPDGRQLLFGAMTADGHNQLWVRSLDALTAELDRGVEAVSDPYTPN